MRKYFFFLSLLLAAALAGCNNNDDGCLFCGPDPEPEPTPLEIIDDFLPVNEQNESKKRLACLVNGQPLMTYQTSNKEYARAHAYPPEEEWGRRVPFLSIRASTRDWPQESGNGQGPTFNMWLFAFNFKTDTTYKFDDFTKLIREQGIEPSENQSFTRLKYMYGQNNWRVADVVEQNYIRFFRIDMKPPYAGPTIDDLYPIANGVFAATFVDTLTGDVVRITDGRFNLHIR